MRDFVLSAVPFVIIAVCVALMCANHERWKDNDHYMLPGMSIGMCMGISFACALKFNLGLGIILGMLVGMTIGMFIKRGDE